MKAHSMNSIFKHLMSAGCLLMAIAGGSHAADDTYSVPTMINYQGQLVDSTGDVITGNHTAEFRIFDSLSGGALMWGRAFPIALTPKGQFNILLTDDGESLDGATHESLVDVFAEENRFLEVTLQDMGTAIAPRQQFLSAPFAIAARSARASAHDLTVPGDLTVGGALLAPKGYLIIEEEGTVTTENLLSKDRLRIDGSLNAATAHVSAHTFDGTGTVPIGSIIMWYGGVEAIPAGWSLCDGQKGTPDLRNRFVVGVGNEYNLNATGGLDKVTLTLSEIPSHTHNITTRTNSYSIWDPGGKKNDKLWNFSSSKNTSAAGGGQPHENRPPFMALCYIMRTE